MSDNALMTAYGIGVVVLVLALLTYAAVSREYESLAGLILVPLWPPVALISLVVGAGWLYIKGVQLAWARLHRPAPKPDAYAVAASQEVEQILAGARDAGGER